MMGRRSRFIWAEKGGRDAQWASKHTIMPKHKKDKHAKSIVKGLDHEQAGVPPVGGKKQATKGDNKAFQQEDAAKRKGSFEGTGQHARTGNRGHQ